MIDDAMTDEDFASLIKQEMESALDHVYAEIQPERERVLQYLRGQMPDLPVEPGASSVVDQTVSDYIAIALPGLMRIFTSGARVGEYQADDQHAEDIADCLGAYAHRVLARDNGGDVLLYNWMRDALTQKVGVIHVTEQLDETVDTETVTLNSVEMDYKIAAASAAGIEMSRYRYDSATGEATATFTRRTVDSRIELQLVAPEDFVLDRDARRVDDARFIAIRSRATVGQLIELGYSADDLLAATTDDDRYDSHARTGYDQHYHDELGDAYARQVSLSTCYILCNRDGTGIKRWRVLVAGFGSSVVVLDEVEWPGDLPLAVLRPNPDHHSFYTRCPADDLCDVQKAKTFVMRKAMTNLAHATSPQRAVLSSALEDPSELITMAPHQTVRIKGNMPPANAVMPLVTPYVGTPALEMAHFWDTTAEMRMGMGKASAGLDPEALTNQSATAANIQQSAAAGRVEMIARIFAATGFTQLFRLIAAHVVGSRHQMERLYRTSPKAARYPPQAFEQAADWQVEVNTGLGTGNRERDAQSLMLLIQQIQQVMGAFGPDNPLAGLQQLHSAYQKLTESLGIRDTERFWADPAPALAAAQQNPQQAPPDPAMIMAQAEMIKAETAKAKVELDAQKLALDREKANQDAVEAGHALGIKQQEVDLKATVEGYKLGQQDINIPRI